MNEAYEIDYIPPNDYREYWETKDRKLIKYSEMTNSHLLSAHRWLSNKIIDAMNRAMSRNDEPYIPEWVENAINGLETELDKRNLLKK